MERPKEEGKNLVRDRKNDCFPHRPKLIREAEELVSRRQGQGQVVRDRAADSWRVRYTIVVHRTATTQACCTD